MTLITDIWLSFRSLPGWVQIWVAMILVPVNSASIFFVGQPSGIGIASLAIVAMLCNIPIMISEKGFSKMMALPHVPLWSGLVAWLIFARPEGSVLYGQFLTFLLVIDVISLCFDYPDAWTWMKGDREVSRPTS